MTDFAAARQVMARVGGEDVSPSKLPSVAVAHLGARLHYGAATVLHKHGCLHQLFTDAYAGNESALGSFLRHVPAPAKRGGIGRLEQRTADLPASKVTAYNWLGLKYSALLHLFDASSVYRQINPEFCSLVARSPEFHTAQAIYSLNGTCLELLQASPDKLRVVEQMIATVGELTKQVEQEQRDWPDWETRYSGMKDLEYWAERESREWHLAHLVISPSTYVSESLIRCGVPATKIRSVPYAVQVADFEPRVRQRDPSRPLRVLFVGGVSLRKGVPYLLEALRKLGPNHVEARLVGAVSIDPARLASYADVAACLGQVSRREVRDHYSWADIFVMPSVCEGSATVTYEAAACGLPVVATPNSGAWVDDGIDGEIVANRASDAIATSLERFLDEPHRLTIMSQAAVKSRMRFDWSTYGLNLTSALREASTARDSARGTQLVNKSHETQHSS